jgi:hypothetical protein
MAWAGSAAVIFGSLLPWVNGPSGGHFADGQVVTLVCGLIMAAIAFRFPRGWAAIVALLVALVAAAASVYETAHISSIRGLSIGFGLALTDAAVICCIAATVVALAERGSGVTNGTPPHPRS